MEITVLNELTRPLLKRREVTVRVHFDSHTPSRQQLADALSDKLKCPRELLIVRQIKTAFGDTAARVVCYCYSDAATLKEIERDNMQEKHKKQAPPPEEKPAEASAEKAEPESPKEEAAEEPKTEAKPEESTDGEPSKDAAAEKPETPAEEK